MSMGILRAMIAYRPEVYIVVFRILPILVKLSQEQLFSRSYSFVSAGGEIFLDSFFIFILDVFGLSGMSLLPRLRDELFEK